VTAPPPAPTLFPYTTLFRSRDAGEAVSADVEEVVAHRGHHNSVGRGRFLWRPLHGRGRARPARDVSAGLAHPALRLRPRSRRGRSEEHTSELQSRVDLVCRL